MKPEQLDRTAAFYRAGIAHGIFEPGAAIAWADSLITHHTDLPSAVYDVSLAPGGRSLPVTDALSRLTSTLTVDNTIVRALLDVLRDQIAGKRLTPYDAIKRAYALTTELGYHSPLCIEAMILEENYSLAADGIVGDKSQLDREIVEWFASFTDAAASFRAAAA